MKSIIMKVTILDVTVIITVVCNYKVYRTAAQLKVTQEEFQYVYIKADKTATHEAFPPAP